VATSKGGGKKKGVFSKRIPAPQGKGKRGKGKGRAALRQCVRKDEERHDCQALRKGREQAKKKREDKGLDGKKAGKREKRVFVVRLFERGGERP